MPTPTPPIHKGDVDPWRDIGHAKWFDPLAALEDPSSTESKAALAEEAALFRDATEEAGARKKAAAWQRRIAALTKAAMPASPLFADETILWSAAGVTFEVKLQHRPGYRLNVWMYKAGGALFRKFEGLTAFGVEEGGAHFYTIEDAGSGSQLLKLCMYDVAAAAAAAAAPRWSKSPVGPAAAFDGDGGLYYLRIENVLRSSGVLHCRAASGTGNHVVYFEEDRRFNVELWAPPRQPHVFLRTYNALSMRIGRLDDDKVKWQTPAVPSDADGSGEMLVPVSATVYASNTAIHVASRRMPLPKGEWIVEAALCNAAELLVVTVSKGVSRIYLLPLAEGSAQHWNLLLEAQDPTAPCEFHIHAASSRPTFAYMTPKEAKRIYEVVAGAAVLVQTFPAPVELPHFRHGFAKSPDGTQVPWTYVSATVRPRKLIVDAYGAYGLSARRSYPLHWLPYLERGYALAVAMPRGGRENGDAWYDAGRTALRKIHTFEDTAAVIAEVQRRFKFPKQSTLFYGRSAGGWLAAHIATKHSDLVACVNAEVPYLDVLRTTTNPSLPLTVLEYDEFGWPAKRPEEFAALQTMSPVDSVPAAPLDAPRILVRTALHDTQVYPYEALKWAKKLRGAGWNVVVGVDDDGGHFATERAAAVQQGTDAALIDSCLKPRSAVGRKTRRLRHSPRNRPQTSRGTRRRRTSS